MEDNKFPAGMRVLAVDDNSTCLIILEALLRKCQYNVTTTKEATRALQILRENKIEFDLVMTEVDLQPHDMDGFKLLQEISLQMDIPVLLVSSDYNKDRVMKGVANGACDYLLKPVRIEELKNIWQHVVRRKLIRTKNKYYYYGASETVHDQMQQASSKKSKDDIIKEEVDDYDDDDDDDDDDEDLDEKGQLQPISKQKKPRVVWLPELHRKFVAAVDQLGVDKAVPKRILELMNVEGITRENVASHLQKYRMYLKKSNGPQANSAYNYGQVDNRQIIRGGSSTSRQCISSYPAGSVLGSSRQGNYNHQWDHSDNNNLMYTTTNDHNNNDIHYSMHSMNEQTRGGVPIASDDFSINCDFVADNNNNNLMLEVDQHLLNAAPLLHVSGNNHHQADSLTRDFSTKLTNFDRCNNNNNWPSAPIHQTPTRVCHEQGGTNFHLPSNTTSAAAAAHLVIYPHHRRQLSSLRQAHLVTHDATSYNSTPCQNIIRREFPNDSSPEYDDNNDHMRMVPCQGSSTMPKMLEPPASYNNNVDLLLENLMNDSG